MNLRAALPTLDSVVPTVVVSVSARAGVGTLLELTLYHTFDMPV
jgi:hypothetical protein